jgi:hypothetical protein
MFTFPPNRGRGYGQQVVRRAAEYIQDSDVDLGILFCRPALIPFYGASGWQAAQVPAHIGTPEDYRVYDERTMLLYVSEKGRQAKSAFDAHPLVIQSPW